MRWTQCPTSAVGSGMYWEWRPLVIGFQVWPPSSERKAPAEEMATKIRLVVLRVEQDRVQAHPARARLPLGAGAVPAQPGQLLPVLPAVRRAEDGGVLDAREHRVRVLERRLEVPDALELPRLLRAVVVLVGGEGRRRRVVDELVALALRRPVRHGRGLALGRARLVPGLAAVVRALDDLPEPAARLRGVDAVGIGGRSLQVVDLPAREVGTLHVPLLALGVGGQDEGALAGADEDSHSTHPQLTFLARRRHLGRRRPSSLPTPAGADCSIRRLDKEAGRAGFARPARAVGPGAP